VQRLVGLRTGISGGADLAKGGRRLEHACVKTEGGERMCRGESGKTTTDNRSTPLFCHSSPRSSTG